MNLFRKLASGKRNRYTQDQYNLDITYITPRIIAMSFPAKGMEKIYRNPISKVAKFLQEKHGDNYLVFNFSDRKYNYAKFDNKVEAYDWRDHHAPKVAVLFEACKRMYEFLQEKDDNVIVVHCNAGKGRTGTSIACFLMYCGLSKNSADAINYYGWKRFSTGRGVSQPCQLRYIHYFEGALKREVLCPVPKILECIVIKTIPKINQNGCKPYVDICNGDYQLMYSTKNSINLRKYKAGPKETEEFSIIKIVPEKKNLVVAGDAHFFIKHKGSFSNTNICRFSINTGFIENELVIPKNQISPDSVLVSKKFHKNFQVSVIMRDYCEHCTSKTELNDVCERCAMKMPKQMKEWSRINEIIEERSSHPAKEVGERICFNTIDTCTRCKTEGWIDTAKISKCPHIDYEQVTNKEVAVEVDDYSVVRETEECCSSDQDGELAKREGLQDFQPIRYQQEDLLESKNSNEESKVSRKRTEDDEFMHALSKEERNTMWLKDDNLEERKDIPEDYFRSVNEFQSREEDHLFPKHSQYVMKEEYDQDTPQIEELSSSSSSKKSGGSELDFRQKKQKCMRTIRRYSRDPRIQNDLEVLEHLRKLSFAITEEDALDHLVEFGGREKSHSHLELSAQ